MRQAVPSITGMCRERELALATRPQLQTMYIAIVIIDIAGPEKDRFDDDER